MFVALCALPWRKRCGWYLCGSVFRKTPCSCHCGTHAPPVVKMQQLFSDCHQEFEILRAGLHLHLSSEVKKFQQNAEENRRRVLSCPQPAYWESAAIRTSSETFGIAQTYNPCGEQSGSSQAMKLILICQNWCLHAKIYCLLSEDPWWKWIL